MPRSRCLPSPRCCLPRIRGHSGSPLLFFLLSTRFATSLTFVFTPVFRFKTAFCGVFGDFQLVAQSSPATSSSCSSIRWKNQTRAPLALERKFSLRSTRIPAAVLKQALYDSKRTSPRSTRPLPSSRRRSAPYRQGHRQASSIERSTNGCHGTKSLLPRCSITFHQQDGSPTVQRAGPVFASTFRRTPNLEGVAADYRSWRIESSPSAHSSEISASNGLWNGSKASFSIPRWSSTTRG